MHVLIAQELQQQFNVVGKERPALRRILAENLKGTSKNTSATSDYFGATSAKHIEGRVIFGNPKRIKVGDQRHPGRQAQSLRPFTNCSQHDRRGRQLIAAPMVFAEVNCMHTDLFGKYGLIDQGTVPFRFSPDIAGVRIGQQVAQREQTYFCTGFCIG
jgi:hypothetical protein